MPWNEIVSIDRHFSAGSQLWRSVMQNNIEGIEVREQAYAFNGAIRRFDFAGARLWDISSAAHHVERRRPCIDRPLSPMVVIQIEGQSRFEHFGSSWQMCEGDFAFLDASKAIDIQVGGGNRQLYVQFPGAAFRAGKYSRAVARLVHSESHAMDRLFTDYVKELWLIAESLTFNDYSASLASLIGLAKLTSVYRKAEQTSAMPVRVVRAMEFIENNLAEDWLSPQAIADSQRVSRRYLDDMFSQCGHSLKTWIWQRRVDRAAEEIQYSLSAGGSQRKTLLEIALSVGFKSPSHFSRVFSAHYGITPRDYQKQLAAGGTEVLISPVS